MDSHATEVAAGKRFQFGRNWARFLSVLDDRRIAEAERSLRDMLGITTLEGTTFLDVGSGSGLFSLAARRLGARVTSFDYDPQSVACTAELKRRYFEGDAHWRVERGSVLDQAYLRALGRFDTVYAWGVLHHTGDMWQALENVRALVEPGGRLFIALYNDQGVASHVWRGFKRVYCSGWPGRVVTLGVCVPYFVGLGLAADVIRGRDPRKRYTGYGEASRGMSPLYDTIDWLGGYPFEVAKPGDIFEFFTRTGFRLSRMVTRAGLANNEFVFDRPGI